MALLVPKGIARYPDTGDSVKVGLCMRGKVDVRMRIKVAVRMRVQVDVRMRIKVAVRIRVQVDAC